MLGKHLVKEKLATATPLSNGVLWSANAYS